MRIRKKIYEFYNPSTPISIDELISRFNFTERESKFIKKIINIIVEDIKTVEIGSDTWIYISELFDWANDGILGNAIKEKDKKNSFLRWSDSMNPHILSATIKYLDKNHGIVNNSFALAISYGIMEGIYNKFFNNNTEIVVESTTNRLSDYVNKVAQIILNETILEVIEGWEKVFVGIVEYPFIQKSNHSNVVYNKWDIIDLRKDRKIKFSIMDQIKFIEHCRDVYGLTTDETLNCSTIYQDMLRKKIIDLWDTHLKR